MQHPHSGIFRFSFFHAMDIICTDISEIDASYPIISVGSGVGNLEYLIRERTERPVICIDPQLDQNFSNKKLPHDLRRQCIPPKYDYLKSIPNIDDYIGKCILFISWPNPQDYYKDFTSTTSDKAYDYEAFNVLKPALFILSYEACGGAASLKMINAVLGLRQDFIWKPSTANYQPNQSNVASTIKLESDNTQYSLKNLYDNRLVSKTAFNGTTLRLVTYVKNNTDSEIPENRRCDSINIDNLIK